MAREAKSYKRGFEEGRRVALLYLSICIDTYPKEPSEMTTELVGAGDADMSGIYSELQRFAEALDERGRRRRRTNVAEIADGPVVEEAEATQ